MDPKLEKLIAIAAGIICALVAGQTWIPLSIETKAAIAGVAIYLFGYATRNGEERALRRQARDSMAPPAEKARRGTAGMGALWMVLIVLLTACGGIAAYLKPVVDATSEIMEWVDRIEDFAAPALAELDPATRQDIEKALQDVRATGAVIDAAGNGAIKLDESQTAKAFDDFEAAYLRYVALTERFGVRLGRPGDRMGVSPGRLTVPKPEDLLAAAEQS